MIKKSILLLAACSCIGGASFAQKCATDEVFQEARKADPKVDQFQQLLNDAWKDVMNSTTSKAGSSTSKTTAGSIDPWKDYDSIKAKKIIIPVVVHIIHDYGTEYISDNAVFAMINEMNQRYNAQNSDLSQVIDPFKPIIGNANIEFRLAQKDPFGNPTTGITRRRSYLTQGGDDQAKFDLWAPNRYLNIWFIRKIGRGISGGSVLAYATPPSSGAAFPYSDGVISIASEATGGIAGKSTIAHEVGHYLNLAHPWNSSNKGAGEACGDDDVDDTPPTKGHFGASGDCNNLYFLYDTNCANLTSPVPGGFEDLYNDSVVFQKIMVSGTTGIANLSGTTYPGTLYQFVSTVGSGNYYAVSTSADGGIFFAAKNDGKVYQFNSTTLATIKSTTKQFFDIASGRTNGVLYGITDSALVRMNVSTDAMASSQKFGILYKLEERPNSNEVWVTSGNKICIVRDTITTDASTVMGSDTTIIAGSNVNDFGDIRFTKDGLYAFKLSNSSNRLYRIDAVTKAIKDSITTHYSGVNGLELTKDQTKVYVSCPAAFKIYIYSTSTLALVDSIATVRRPYTLYSNPHPLKSEIWAVNTADNFVTVYNDVNKTQVRTLAAATSNGTIAFRTWNKYFTNSAAWGNLNVIQRYEDTTNFTFKKVNTGAPVSTSYLHLTTDSIAVVNQLKPGRAILGGMDNVTFAPVNAGMPYTKRTKRLTGFYKYQANGSDQGFISVALTRWDSATSKRDTVASVMSSLAGSQTSWKYFSIPLVYKSTTKKPDSAVIVLSSSSTNSSLWAKGSYLDIDHLLLTEGEDGYFKTTVLGDTAEYPDVTNTQNIMDYADCEINFTKQQVMRMRAALNNNVANRNNLITVSNQQVTGIGDTAAGSYKRNDLKPVPDFSIEKGLFADGTYYMCGDAQHTFNFKNQTWRDTVIAINWEFTNGATPSSSTSTGAVNVTFSQPGWATIKMRATGNNSGDSSIERKDVYVADPNYVINPMEGYFQEFSNATENDKWPSFNYYNNDYKWEVVNNNGFYDKSCIVYKGFDSRTYPNGLVGTPAHVSAAAGKAGDYDDFFTPAFDLSAMQSGNCNLNFMYAGVWRTTFSSLMNDSLEIAYSTSCGTQWQTMAVLTKGDLSTGTYSNAYYPLSMSDWDLKSISVPAAARQNKVMFRFRYKPMTDDNTILYLGTGNNYYIDRINVSPFGTGINTLVNKGKNIVVAPNPARGKSAVMIANNMNSNTTVTVTDMTGKVVYRTHRVLASNMEEIEIPEAVIATKGFYIVNVVAGTETKTEKLVSY